MRIQPQLVPVPGSGVLLNQPVADLAKMLESVTSDHHPVQGNFEQEIAFYVDDLKSVGVMKPSVDPAKFASRVYADVLT